ncbi:MAG: Calx-beta domain-containing protein, partial [Pirellulales bacterium]
IFANGGLGIITGINGVLSTYAEQRGVDAAQTAPVLTSAIFDPQGTVLTGSLTGVPFTRYEIDFFANDTVNPSGFGDGQTYLQSISALVDDSGTTSFQIPLDQAVPVGEWITATATPTDQSGNTSLFSRPIPVIAADPETVQFVSPSYIVTETGGAAVLLITRTGSTAGTATVDYATSDGTASAGINYTAESGTVIFNDGQTTATITIPVADDGIADGGSTFFIDLTNPTGTNLGPVTHSVVTVADSDTDGEIEFASGAVTTDRAVDSASLNVTRVGGSQGTVTVEYQVTGGTAVPLITYPGSGELDYEDNFGTVTFAPGQTTAQISFLYVQDLLNNDPQTPVYRGPQTIQVTLGNPTGGATLGPITTSVLTIDDDENQHGAFGVSNFSQTIVNESDGKVQIDVFRSGQISTAESVSYSTVDGTAKAGTNYRATSGTLTFQPGDTQAFFYVPIIDDHIVDDPGDFQVVLSNPSGGAFVYPTRGTADVTILDSDVPTPGHFVVGAATFAENAGIATITVGRSGGAQGEAQVDYATSDGTATAGADYTAVSGTLSFSPGQTLSTFTVPILPDNLVEGDETFFVTLSDPTGGATVGPLDEGGTQYDNPAVETISETAGQVQFSAADYRVAENNATLTVTVVFTLDPGAQLGGDPNTNNYAPVTVDYSTHDGTATSGADYTAVSGTLTINSYLATQTFTIPILNDLLVESDETFFLTLSNATGGARIGENGTATVTILDEDSQPAVQTTTTLASDLPNGSTYGQTVGLTAVLGAATGTPTGSVDFVDSTTGQDLGTVQLAVVDGLDEASVWVSSLDVRSHTIVATYTSDTDNFVASHDSLTQSVAPATLIVTAGNKAMVYGTIVPALTDTISGFVNGDTSSVVTGAASLTTAATAASGVGSYPIDVALGTLSA